MFHNMSKSSMLIVMCSFLSRKKRALEILFTYNEKELSNIKFVTSNVSNRMVINIKYKSVQKRILCNFCEIVGSLLSYFTELFETKLQKIFLKMFNYFILFQGFILCFCIMSRYLELSHIDL